MVAAIQRAKYALNDLWSTWQVPTGSQARSYMTFSGLVLKKTVVASRIWRVRFRQMSLPSVWIGQ